MTWWEAALWGLAGGAAASVASLAHTVVSGGYRWPWRREGELGPRLFVLASGLMLGAVVAAAAHGQMSGPWPAFIFGISAPATIRGVLSGVEVTPLNLTAQHQLRGARDRAPDRLPLLSREGEVREEAP